MEPEDVRPGALFLTAYGAVGRIMEADSSKEEQAMPPWEKLSECVSVTDCGVSIDDPECGRVRVSLVDSEDERGPGDDEIAALLHGRLGNRWHRVTDWSSASLEPDVSSTWEVWS